MHVIQDAIDDYNLVVEFFVAGAEDDFDRANNIRVGSRHAFDRLLHTHTRPFADIGVRAPRNSAAQGLAEILEAFGGQCSGLHPEVARQAQATSFMS